MLYFLYQYYQGISHDVFTVVEVAKKSVCFISDFITDFTDCFSGIVFPPLVLSVLTLTFSLGVFDKVTHALKG